VRAALSVPENRAAAEDAHTRAMLRTGRLWGTLLGLCGTSHGESLVARNVGIRSVWSGERHAAEVTFMDHDNLHVGGSPRGVPRPEVLRIGAAKDHLALFGGVYKGARVRGSVELLEAIFAVEPRALRLGRAALTGAFEEAFLATRRAVREDSQVQALLPASFQEGAARAEETVNGLFRDFLSGKRGPLP